jgi:signal peptidase II
MGYHWPAFNIADTMITVGAAVLIFDSLFVRGEPAKRGQGNERKKR